MKPFPNRDVRAFNRMLDRNLVALADPISNPLGHAKWADQLVNNRRRALRDVASYLFGIRFSLPRAALAKAGQA